ncbi:MAG TPA: tetratricopeptide repeat protein [Symbiobacteriaceae bacterium]|jgi:tetratricopeptide (TPR) repeat protein|nr:tetratricopeptide repeat protein [Symbiobacteriaceae bacterium]
MLEAGLTTVPRLRYLLERGRVFRSSGQPALAIPLFLEAWSLGQQSGEDDLATEAAHMLGITEPDPARQMEWNMRALDLAERSPKARRWCGSLYNNIGWALAGAGEYEQALELFQRAVRFREEQGAPVPLRIARWCVAKMLRLLNRTEEALALQQELYQQVDPAAGEDGFILGDRRVPSAAGQAGRGSALVCSGLSHSLPGPVAGAARTRSPSPAAGAGRIERLIQSGQVPRRA